MTESGKVLTEHNVHEVLILHDAGHMSLSDVFDYLVQTITVLNVPLYRSILEARHWLDEFRPWLHRPIPPSEEAREAFEEWDRIESDKPQFTEAVWPDFLEIAKTMLDRYGRELQMPGVLAYELGVAFEAGYEAGYAHAKAQEPVGQ